MRLIVQIVALIVCFSIVHEVCNQFQSIRYYFEISGSFVISAIIVWQLHYYLHGLVCKLLMSQVSPENKAIFITGCDSGFGHAAAGRLASIGFHVFAGCLVKPLLYYELYSTIVVKSLSI